MSNALQLFNFQDQPVRVVMISGEPWWVAADVCKVLGIRNVADAVNRLDQKGVALNDTLTSGGYQKLTIANEPNLYRLIFRSNKPQAKDFQDWVFGEVIPSIRKTGSYSTGPARKQFPWTEEAERLRQLNLKYIQPGYFSISEVILQKLIYANMEGVTPNERAKIDISVGNFFQRWLKGDRSGQLKDCLIVPEHPYDKLKMKHVGHMVDSVTGGFAKVYHYANMYMGDFSNFWDSWYVPVILPVYFNGKLPDGIPRVTFVLQKVG